MPKPADDPRSPTRPAAPSGSDADLRDAGAKKNETGTEVRAEPADDREVTRQGEAGNAYVGRGMDDRLKENPRIEDADEVTPEE